MQRGEKHRPALANGNSSSGTPNKAMQKQRAKFKRDVQSLPIWEAKEQLVAQLKEHKTLVLIGETGSGKTTQLPQLLLDSVLPKGAAVACTQPRRVAATSISYRVARERGVSLGQEVGYSVRFDDRTSPATRIKYMTDGMLLREALLDPLLKRYKAIVLDEAHERTVQTDVLFGLVKAAQEKRADGLRLVIMSATLDAAKFVKYFPGAKAAYLEGRQFPVEHLYTEEAVQSYVDAAIMAVLQLHEDEAPGDILVFLTGQEEIENVERLLKERQEKVKGPPGCEKLHVTAMFAAQPPELQANTFKPAPEGSRKVILATNIAETSLTVPGVRYVVDTGLVKARSFQAQQAIESLQVVPVSQAQARQRSGRAGREAAGKAFRLYTEDAYWKLESTTAPEIQRVRLDTVVLQLKALQVPDPLSFDFMDKPPTGALERALELLHALGALDEEGQLTHPLGTNLAKLPVEPTLGKVLLAATEMGCVASALAVVAAASSEKIFVTRRLLQPVAVPYRQQQEATCEAQRRFLHPHGDHLTLLSVYTDFMQAEDPKRFCQQHRLNHRSLSKAVDIHKQLKGYLERIGVPVPAGGGDACTEDSSGESLRRALTAGLFMNAATLQFDRSYKVVASGQIVSIHPASVLYGKQAKCIVFSELIRTARTYALNVTAIEPSWLPELAPSVFAARPAVP